MRVVLPRYRSAPYAIAALLIVCLLSPALQRAVSAQGSKEASAAKPQKFKSRSFEVTSDLDAARARELAAFMDQMQEDYQQALPDLPVKNERTMRLLLFREGSDYSSQLRGVGIKEPGNAGQFFYDDKNAYVAACHSRRDDEAVEATLRHEGFHLFTFTRFGNSLPPWAEEGLAEYFAEALIVRGKLRVGLVPDARLKRVQRAIASGSAVGLKELLYMSDAEWAKTIGGKQYIAGELYDQSWSVVYFLMNGAGGAFAEAFQTFLRACAEGTPLEESLKHAFGAGNLEELENQWKQAILQLHPDPLLASVEKLQFLASGLRWVHGYGDRPSTIKQLQADLIKRQFTLMSSTHRATTTKSGLSDFHYEPPAVPAGQKPVQFVIAPNRNPSFPANMYITGLPERISIDWRKNADGELTFRIVVK